MEWIYLSKRGQDEYINMLAAGAGHAPTVLEDWQYEDRPSAGLYIRGIMKHKLIKKCWQDQRPFFFVDSGYFGNRAGHGNPGGWKLWHRIVPNDLQHNRLIARSSDRWDRLRIPIHPWRRTGSKILIAAPDDKACAFYGTTAAAWLRETLDVIKNHSDRPVIVRARQKDAHARTRNPATNFQSALTDDVFAVVCFNSSAAIEAVLHGIPVFVTAPTHAAKPVGLDDLTRIETPAYPDMDLLRAWASHLAWGQFHVKEMADGRANRMLQEMIASGVRS